MATGLPIADKKKPPPPSKHATEGKHSDELEAEGGGVGEDVDEEVGSPVEAKIQRQEGFFKGFTVEVKLNILSSNINYSELSFLEQNVIFFPLRNLYQVFPLPPQVTHFLIPVVALHTMASRSTEPTRTVAFTVVLQTPTLLAVAL